MLYKYIGSTFPDYTDKYVEIGLELFTGELVAYLLPEQIELEGSDFWRKAFLCSKDELEGVN